MSAYLMPIKLMKPIKIGLIAYTSVSAGPVKEKNTHTTLRLATSVSSSSSSAAAPRAHAMPRRLAGYASSSSPQAATHVGVAHGPASSRPAAARADAATGPSAACAGGSITERPRRRHRGSSGRRLALHHESRYLLFLPPADTGAAAAAGPAAACDGRCGAGSCPGWRALPAAARTDEDPTNTPGLPRPRRRIRHRRPRVPRRPPHGGVGTASITSLKSFLLLCPQIDLVLNLGFQIDSVLHLRFQLLWLQTLILDSG